MKKFHPFLLGLFLLIAPDATAVRPYQPVHPDPVLEPWRWTAFPELDGQELSCLAEDRHGHTWFGADEGAVRYDGVGDNPKVYRIAGWNQFGAKERGQRLGAYGAHSSCLHRA